MMTPIDYFYLAIGVIVFAFVFWFVQSTKKHNRRLGWQAYHDGLPINLAWGDDICNGWYAAQRGEPRP